MTSRNVLVFVETEAGKPLKSAAEALGEAQRLASVCGGEAVAVLLGPGVRALAGSLSGVARVFYSEDELFERFHVPAMADAILQAVRESGADVVTLAATPAGRELAGTLAADLDTAVAADVVDLAMVEDQLEVVRPVYAGKALLTCRFRRFPAVVTLRPNVFAAAESSGESSPELVTLPAPTPRDDYSVVGCVEPEQVTRELTEAKAIVAGGRGLKGPENFHILEELAEALGAAVGASRAVCDAGWRPHSEQIGQTGKTVSPRLYVACGISGAIQHLAGMSSSRCIVAINKDPQAPIFKVADYGVVGDLFEVVPELTAQLKAR